MQGHVALISKRGDDGRRKNTITDPMKNRREIQAEQNLASHTMIFVFATGCCQQTTFHTMLAYCSLGWDCKTTRPPLCPISQSTFNRKK
eukprot:scaffold500302_cov15-Prasinocladus_malaysianus.AAC.1